MTISPEIKQKLCELLRVSTRELDTLIDNIKRKHGVSEVVAIIQLLTKKGLMDVATDIIEELLLSSRVMRLSEVEVGMRAITIIGRVDVIKTYKNEKAKYGAILLVSDGATMAQIYIPRIDTILDDLEGLKIGDLVVVKNVNISGRFRSGILKAIVSNEGRIRRLDDESARKFVDSVPPPIRIIDISDLKKTSLEKFTYYHVRGVLMKVITDTRKEGLSKCKILRVLLGDVKNYCSDRVLCSFMDRAIGEYEKVRPKIGDIIIIHGAFLKEADGKLFVVARNISAVEKKTPPSVNIKDIQENGWWRFIIKIKSRPRIGTYTKNSTRHRYLFVTAEIETGEDIRLVVWNEDIVDLVADFGIGDKIGVFGQVRYGGGTWEVHIQPNMGHVELIEKASRGYETRWRPLANKISELSEGKIFDVILRVERIQKVSGEKLVGLAWLSDGENEIKFLMWDDGLVSRIEDAVKSLVKITNVKIVRDRRGEGLVIMATRKTSVLELTGNYNFWGMEGILEGGVTYRPIGGLGIGDRARIWGVVTGVDWVGPVYFCGRCGGFIVDLEKRICEQGHKGDVVEKNIVSLSIDDGYSTIMAMVPLKLLIGKESADTNIDAVEGILSGEEVCLEGILRLDYSSGKPVRVFVADKICRTSPIRYFLDTLRSR